VSSSGDSSVKALTAAIDPPKAMARARQIPMANFGSISFFTSYGARGTTLCHRGWYMKRFMGHPFKSGTNIEYSLEKDFR
jgi:hypothetical protein